MAALILTGDCRKILQRLTADSVHCCVTSPPYWGLRDYGVSGQIGLEASFTDFIAEMVTVFREVRRVLRPDGTLWLNLGDSYAMSTKGSSGKGEKQITNAGTLLADRSWKVPSGLKPKDLCGIPWRVALALQADGWWLRQDIVWSKPNPMPESVTDRCTKAHEYVFLMSKSAKYFYDAEAIKEDASTFGRQGTCGILSPKTQALQDDGTHGKGGDLGINYSRSARNKRSVWEIATSPFKGAHFATFPPKLIEPCIKAGTSEQGCCSKCGAPWKRVVEKGDLVPTRKHYDKRVYGVVVDNPDPQDQGRNRARDGHRSNMAYEKTTLGWSPTCKCNAPVIPCTVLDPFGGAGTVGLVGNHLGRDSILVELSPAYVKMAKNRIYEDSLKKSPQNPRRRNRVPFVTATAASSQ